MRFTGGGYVDIMKILAELYLHQLGIEATVEPEPIKRENKIETVDKTQ